MANQIESNTPKIYAAMSAVMSSVGHISKDKVNTQQGYNFRGIDDVYNALHNSLVKNSVFALPTVLSRVSTDRVTKNGVAMYHVVLRVKFTFYTTDGSSVETITEGEAMDMADKSTNKAQSAAFKYAMMQAFSIPTKELIDEDASTPPESMPEVKKEFTAEEKADMRKFFKEEVAKGRLEGVDAINKIEAKYKERGVDSTDDLKMLEAHISKIYPHENSL